MIRVINLHPTGWQEVPAPAPLAWLALALALAIGGLTVAALLISAGLAATVQAYAVALLPAAGGLGIALGLLFEELRL